MIEVHDAQEDDVDHIVQVDVVPMQRWDARVQLQRDVVQDELLLCEDVDLNLDVIEVHDAQEDDVDHIVQVDVVPEQRWDARVQLQRDVVQDKVPLCEDVDLGLDVIEVHDAQEEADVFVQVDVVPVQRWDVRVQLQRDVVQDELLPCEDVDLGLDVIEVHDEQKEAMCEGFSMREDNPQPPSTFWSKQGFGDWKDYPQPPFQSP